MKKLLVVIATLCLGEVIAEESATIQGQRSVQVSLVKWTTGANTGKTRLKFLTNNVYLDTSSTGQAGEFKRIDNTADSCSSGFLLASDSNGVTLPVWQYLLWQLVTSPDADSSTHVYRVQTREKVYNSTLKKTQLTPWSIKGANTGYSDVVVQDSVLMGNIRVTTKASQYSFFKVAGTIARLCPDDIPATAGQAGDSIIVDSIRVYTR